MPRPDLSRVPAFYHNYINQVSGDDLMQELKKQSIEFIEFLKAIPKEKYDYRYAEGKWTIKEVLQHIIDAERIFCYRSLCFARKDKTPLPGFDENAYAEYSKAGNRKWKRLVKEFKAVRKASELLFDSFDDEQLNTEGTSNNNLNYVLGFGFITIGHCIHHQKILKERYLQ